MGTCQFRGGSIAPVGVTVIALDHGRKHCSKFGAFISHLLKGGTILRNISELIGQISPITRRITHTMQRTLVPLCSPHKTMLSMKLAAEKQRT